MYQTFMAYVNIKSTFKEYSTDRPMAFVFT